jgi:hypothetical protein
MPNSKSRLQNQLLRALFEKDRSEMTPRLVDLRKAAVLAEPYTALKYVYFPHDSLVSLVSVVSEGTSVEIAMVAQRGIDRSFRSAPRRIHTLPSGRTGPGRRFKNRIQKTETTV